MQRMLCVGLVLTLASCGEDAPVSSFETFEEACAAVDGCGLSVSTDDIWVVEVIRDGDEIRIGSIEAGEARTGDGMPFGPLGGEVALAGRSSAGENIDGQWLRFPEEFEFEREFEGGRLGVPLVGPVSTTGYVRALAEIESIAVVDTRGAILVEAPLPAAIVTDVGARSDALIRGSSSCPHILLLERGILSDFATSDGRRDLEILPPGPVQQAIVDAAFAYAPDSVCAAVGRIAFASLPDMPELGGQVWTGGAGDLIVVNTSRREGLADVYSEEFLATHEEWRTRLMRTLLHEAGHATEALLNEVSVLGEGVDGQWIRSSRGSAALVVENTRLRRGLRTEWADLHARFVAEDWAERHPGVAGGAATIQEYDADQTARAGAMSRYGGTSLGDDIAEMVSWIALADRFTAAGIPTGRGYREDYACQAMATWPEVSVPQRYAAVFSKLRFLEDLGMVETSAVERCVGTVGLDPIAEGMRLSTGESAGRAYTRDVAAQIGTLEGRYVFEMTASGTASFDDTEYPADARL